MAKWIIGIIVVLLIAGAVWYSGILGNMHPATTLQTATTTPETTQQAAAPENGMSANNDASDAALQQDTAAIDTQMQGLSTDSTNVDSSVSDKEVTQSY